MTLEELQSELRDILVLEEQPSVDWVAVKERCLDAIGRLHSEANPTYPHDAVYRFLDDADIREKDHGYGEKQRFKLKGWLSENA